MAVNTSTFKLNFKTLDGRKVRVYISGPLITGGIITVPETQTFYEFTNTTLFSQDVKITAVEVDVTTNPSTIKQNSLSSYVLKSVYNPETDTEELFITTQFATLSGNESKDISIVREHDLLFAFPISTDGFLEFSDIGQINPIINLNGNSPTNDSGVFNSDGTINIDFSRTYGFDEVVVTDDFTTFDYEQAFKAPPLIINPIISNVTKNSAKISWITNYPSDGKIVFLNGNCPINPITKETKCETNTIPANYRTDTLSLEHSFELFNLTPDTVYTLKLVSKFFSDKVGDVVFEYPNKIINPTETNITFTTFPEPDPEPEETPTEEPVRPDPLADILTFEVVFAGNRRDDPDMYYDEEKTDSRVYLNFDYNQPTIKTQGTIVRGEGIRESDRVIITEPILNKKIQLFENTDELTTSKKFIGETPSVNLGFSINEDFEKDEDGNPLFLLGGIYYTVDVADEELTDGDIDIVVSDIATPQNPNKKWKQVIIDENKKFVIPSAELLKIQSGEIGNRLLIVSLYKKRLEYTPLINILDKDGLVFEVPFSEKDKERIIEIPYDKLKYANGVKVTIADKSKNIFLNSEKGIINLSYKNDFQGQTGDKLVQISPIFTEEGEEKVRGLSTSFIIKIVAVDDFPNLLTISRPKKIVIPSYENYDKQYVLKIGATAETNYVDVEIVIDNKKTKLQRLVPVKTSELDTNIIGQVQFHYTFNIQETIQKKFPLWNKENINLVIVPYSSKKITDPLFSNPNDIKGLEYSIETIIEKPKISITLEQIRVVIIDMLIKAMNIKSPKENKYISHLANFDNDNQILISSWENDNFTLSSFETDENGNQKITEEVKSIILKLYKPLPQEITTNSTLWITKLLANPIIETVILREDIKSECPPLRGPNFKIPVDYVTGQSTNFESLDTLILSSSVSSSATLIQDYLNRGNIDTSDLNIQYVSGSIAANTATYLWDNFTHFSSAKERLDNFVYKVQLIEAYENAISSSNYDPTNTGYPNSFTIKQNIELQTEKKNKIIGAFDEFEKFLYTYSSEYSTNDDTSMTWPYDSGVRMLSTTSTVVDWYNSVSLLAEKFDKENKNALLNNIPSYIKNKEENDQFLLFVTMIGQHFDIIYFFNKAIERSRGVNYSSKNGIANKLLYEKLKSFDWDAKNLAANSKLWEYVLGMDTDGNVKQLTAAKQRNSEIWRRILNNIPYLLKHKGTKRAVHALLACYGIPSNNLSILEFGGPEISETTKSKYLIENISSALKFEIGSKVTTLWTNTPFGRKPDTVEIFVKPNAGNLTIVSGSGWSLTASGSTDSKYGRVYFKIGSTEYLSSSLLPIFNGQYLGIELSATTGSPYIFELNVAQNKQERVIFSSSTTASVAAGTAAVWQTAGNIAIGSGFSGSVDEFRLWSTQLNKDIFFEHVAFPEMVNGNHISSSTQDLFFRLDFEYTKNVSVYTTTPNVDNNIYYSEGTTRNFIETNTIVNGNNIFSETTPAIYSASFSGFSSVTNYPYQFEVIERNSVLEIPDLGIQRYSNNKVRFEEQTLNGNVLYKDIRNTIRAYDNAPIDSNKIGLFFSPTKELNIDIAKSLGGINLDDYIGDPRDQYKDTYSSLNRIREYYFNRFDGRDIYAYINLVKLYEQNLFEDIKQLLPARSKVATGILIEPHILERSKIARKKPTAENNQYETSIEYNLQENLIAESYQQEANIDNTETTTLVGENYQYETSINTTLDFSQTAEATQYEGTVPADDIVTPIAEATQYEGNIDTKTNNTTLQAYIDWFTTTIGESDFEKYGFELYAQTPGVAIRNYIDRYGVPKKERVRVNIVTREYTKYFEKYKVTLPNGLADVRGGTEVTSSIVTERLLTVQPFQGTTAPSVGGEIISVEPVLGYLPSHYKFTQDNSTGLQNSFYYGCKLTGIVPIDGKPVVEEFISNPNTLTVNKFGRNSNEPILEVE